MEDGQWELKVTGDGIPGRAVACTKRNLGRTNIVALGAKGRAGPRTGDQQRNLRKAPRCLEGQGWECGTEAGAGTNSDRHRDITR